MRTKSFERRQAFAFTLIREAGPNGAMSNDLAKLLTKEFPGHTLHANETLLRKSSLCGFIYGKTNTSLAGPRLVRYFAAKEWCDAFPEVDMSPEAILERKRAKERAKQAAHTAKQQAMRALLPPKPAKVKPVPEPKVLPKAKAAKLPVERVIPEDATQTFIAPRVVKGKFIGETIIPEHVKVQVCSGYLGDYRIQVDPAHRGEWSKEWQEKRGQQ